MYIIKTGDWHNSHTDIGKFFISRFAQLVDTDEIITNRHLSTNGLILFEELYATSSLSLVRWKNHNRLKNLLAECADSKMSTSIVNDFIIKKYFRPAKDEVISWSKSTFDFKLVSKIQHGALIHSATLKTSYMSHLKNEFENLDLKNGRFDVATKRIDNLLMLLVPQLIYDGHSLAFLQMIPKRLKKKRMDSLVNDLFEFFALSEEREYQCLLPGNEKLVGNLLLENLGANQIQIDAEKFFDCPSSEQAYVFKVRGKDPFSALRSCATEAFRNVSLSIPDLEPTILNSIWETPYYYNDNREKFVPYNFHITRDPIMPNPNYRINTLNQSLTKHDVFLEAVEMETLNLIQEPLYFYNLARTVPSIENSYILLWTSLEALMGLRTDRSDIEIVQANVSHAIALGAVGRRVNSFVDRYLLTANFNGWTLQGPADVSTEDTKGLCEWITWLADSNVNGTQDDPFNIIKTDPLLCKYYRSINECWKSLGVLYEIISKSQQTVNFQLDRLYLTRNLIIHSAKFGRLGEYLWLHLEWYVGKLLAQAILLLKDMLGKITVDPRDYVFGCLQGQYSSTLEYLKRYENDSISVNHLISSGIARFPMLCF